jgi:hypothetical protein
MPARCAAWITFNVTLPGSVRGRSSMRMVAFGISCHVGWDGRMPRGRLCLVASHDGRLLHSMCQNAPGIWNRSRRVPLGQTILTQAAGWHARNGYATRPRPRIGRRRTPIVGGRRTRDVSENRADSGTLGTGSDQYPDSNGQTGLLRREGSPSQHKWTASTLGSRGRDLSHFTKRTQRGGGSRVHDGGNVRAERT